jgi:hypothetical protein
MSAASTTAALPDRPDPLPDPAAASTPAPTPTRTGRVLGLLHKLIDYGKEVVQTLQQRGPTSIDIRTITQHFGTLNIALILMRVVRGLRLATALEARVLAHPRWDDAALAAAADRAAAASAASSERPPRSTEPAAPRTRRPLPPLSDVPSAEEIAEALRRRPLGAVVADICRDLGLGPSHPLWREVMDVVTEYGGNFAKLLSDVLDRLFAWMEDPSLLEDDGGEEPWAQAAAACGTGPP